jgi:hypothetical protein
MDRTILIPPVCRVLGHSGKHRLFHSEEKNMGTNDKKWECNKKRLIQTRKSLYF